MAFRRKLPAAVFLSAALFTANILSAHAQSDQPVRVVIVGLEHGHVDGFLGAFPRQHEAELVGVVDADPALREKAEKNFHLDHSLFYSSLDEAIAARHPQALLVYTSVGDHRRVIEAAAAHNLDVMVEKPLTLSVADALAIRKAAREHHIQVMVNYETTWYSSNKAVMDMAAAGKLGEVRKVVVHDGHGGPKEINVQPEFLKWLTDPALNGAGALYDFGCYGADLMTVLMHGEAPISVTAVAQTDKPGIYPHVDDDATIILRYPHTQAVLMPSWNWTFGRKDMEIYGTTAYAIAVNPTEIKVRTSDRGAEEESTATPLTPPEDTSLHYLAVVVRKQLDPKDDLTGLATNMTVVQILDAARHSAAEGKTITLKPLPQD
ncbi:putative dehydrogenase [Silvibacterium bohemicum]|uniref:Putative dehydrogenase n=1 Tax=Silvibacterium bohemicum TaxID=1577686 RepID=A0A841JS87_9BACT|nr:Gfo/Idh/MocA family oxidoreductase [Silvibacterium bohemicum]MBB6144176.1 putative dehydrogenase [Silvibacterium bohemicum]